MSRPIPDHATTLSNPGLSGAEVHARKTKFGANAMPDATEHLLARIVAKLWAPVP